MTKKFSSLLFSDILSLLSTEVNNSRKMNEQIISYLFDAGPIRKRKLSADADINIIKGFVIF